MGLQVQTLRERYPALHIEVDGGIDVSNIHVVAQGTMAADVSTAADISTGHLSTIHLPACVWLLLRCLVSWDTETSPSSSSLILFPLLLFFRFSFSRYVSFSFYSFFFQKKVVSISHVCVRVCVLSCARVLICACVCARVCVRVYVLCVRVLLQLAPT